MFDVVVHIGKELNFNVNVDTSPCFMTMGLLTSAEEGEKRLLDLLHEQECHHANGPVVVIGIR